MGLLSGILGFLRKIWSLLKKFWWVIALILIVIFIWFPGTWAAIAAWLSTAWTAVAGFAAANGWLSVAAIAFGTYAVLDPEGASELIKDVAEIVGEVGGGIIGGVVGGLTNSPLGLALLIGGGYLVYRMFFAKDKDEDEVGPVVRERIDYQGAR